MLNIASLFSKNIADENPHEDEFNIYFFKDYESPFDGNYIESNKFYFKLIDKLTGKMKTSMNYFEKGHFPNEMLYDHEEEERTWRRHARNWNFYRLVINIFEF